MTYSRLIAILSASALATGCSSTGIQTRIANYTANTPELSNTDVGGFVTRQNEILEDFATLAGVQTPAATGEWRQVIDAGIHYSDVRCDRFMDSLFWFNRVRETTSRQIQFTGAAASAALTIVEASARAIGLTPLGFAFLDQTVNNFGSGLLFNLNPANVRTIVERKQAAYIGSLSASYTNRAIALRVIQNYAAICLPAAIETQVEEAIAAREYEPNRIVPALPPGSTDQVPDAFGFPDVNDQATGTQVESAWARLTGTGATTQIAVVGGEYQIGSASAPWTSSPGTVAPNQMFRVRATSSANSGEATTATLTIGGIPGSFTVRTAAAGTPAAVAPPTPLPDAVAQPITPDVNAIPSPQPPR
jgi:hypothetical protein